MKFKEARGRGGAGGRASRSLNIPTVFEPLFFSLPSSSLEIYISSLLLRWNCLFIPLSFKEPLVAIPFPFLEPLSSNPSPPGIHSLFLFLQLFSSFFPLRLFHTPCHSAFRFLLFPSTSSSSTSLHHEPAAPHLPLYRDNPPFTARLRFVGR